MSVSTLISVYIIIASLLDLKLGILM